MTKNLGVSRILLDRLAGVAAERGTVIRHPTPMTTHRFIFDEVDKALHLMDMKEDGILKPLIIFS